jgi:hypothetical protein
MYSSEVQQRALTRLHLAARRRGTQGIAEPLEHGECRLVGHHGVDLHRDGDLAVSQDLHGHTRVHVEGQAEGQARNARSEPSNAGPNRGAGKEGQTLHKWPVPTAMTTSATAATWRAADRDSLRLCGESRS